MRGVIHLITEVLNHSYKKCDNPSFGDLGDTIDWAVAQRAEILMRKTSEGKWDVSELCGELLDVCLRNLDATEASARSKLSMLLKTTTTVDLPL